MAEQKTTGEMQATLGLTGLTFNAMALIAPGAFLWLTFYAQATEGATSPAMWSGIVFALLLCLATAVSYAELAKLYPGTGSSYYFAEQAFLNHEKAWKWARLMKFIVGWGSHLYYWIYPGVMVAATGAFVGYVVGALWPNFMNASNPGPMFMMLVGIIFTILVCYIAHRGVTGSTAVSVAMNVIQISALLIFSIMAIHYRMSHPPGSVARQWDATSGASYDCEFQMDAQSNIVRDASMNPVCKKDASGAPVPFHIDYPTNDSMGNFLSHASAGSVIGIHRFGWMFVQATVAILILVGFESCTSLGGEAKDPKRHIPIAVITSLLVQGAFCYLFEYFATNYVLSSGYTMQSASGSAAPLADLMVMIGDALFNGHGKAFMLIEAFTVFLALIGTTLACINTGARVTYAMGKDQEVPEHFGLLHEKNLSPHKAIWTLAVVSIIFGCLGLAMYFGDGGAPTDAAIQALPHGFWSSFGYLTHDKMAALPNSFTTITLASNFGTFLLYGLSCVVCMVAYHKHPNFSFIKHWLVPAFGVVANLVCMSFYLIGPFMGYGTKMEPYLALGIAAVWAIYGGIYFVISSRKSGKTTLVTSRA
ncbi:MAG TPA: APC family permease [Candidatus Acidoferrum sp.]|nr:APC family permease [Candidatus Acidoferrum sp.]